MGDISNRLVLAIGFTVVLSGCVPIMEHYYMPSALNGSAVRRDCHGKAGPVSDIEFVRGGVTILITSRYKPESATTLALDVQFQLSQSSHVIVQWSNMKLHQSDGKSISFSTANNTFAYNLPMTLAGMTNAHASNISKMEGNKFSIYEVTLNVTEQLSERFIFELPPMTINGIRYPATNITYMKKQGLWVMPLNC